MSIIACLVLNSVSNVQMSVALTTYRPFGDILRIPSIRSDIWWVQARSVKEQVANTINRLRPVYLFLQCTRAFSSRAFSHASGHFCVSQVSLDRLRKKETVRSLHFE